MPEIVNLSTSGLRRSNRNQKAPNRFGFFSKFCLLSTAALSLHSTLNLMSFISRTMKQFEKVNMNFDGSHNTYHPFAFASSLADNKTYTVKEMLQQPDVASFVNAMVEEVAAHENNEQLAIRKLSLQFGLSNAKGSLTEQSINTKQEFAPTVGCKNGELIIGKPMLKS